MFLLWHYIIIQLFIVGCLNGQLHEVISPYISFFFFVVVVVAYVYCSLSEERFLLCV